MEDLPPPVAQLLALPPGSRVIGPFALHQQLGRGGFAPVWLAQERYAGTELRTVAVKLFSLQGTRGEGQGAARVILSEARTLCQVEHPNIVRFHAIAVDEERHVMGLVMEYLAGAALDQVLRTNGTLSIADAVDVGIAVASALAAAHRAGVVHRDVKPANIVRTQNGYKLIDFGVAMAGYAATPEPVALVAEDVPIADATEARTTLVGRLVNDPERTQPIAFVAGTLGYIDPECLVSNLPANAASDLYALGATLFELVSGSLPARDGDVLRGDVLDGRARSPTLRTVVATASARLGEVVDALLSPQRRDRPRSAEWVATRLQEVRRALSGRREKLPPEEIGPFRGLGRFEAEDQGVYFGRTLEIAQALQVLRVRGLVALLGPSGSGKSSLARAGVLPAVLEGGLGSWPERWTSVVCSPGDRPVSTLKGLAPELDGESPAELVALLGERVQSTGQGLVLLIDQLEELATNSDSDERDWLVGLLLILAEHPLPGIRAVVTARRDLLDPLLALSGLGRAILPSALLVDPMTPLAWSEALEQALVAYGYSWEDETLREAVASDIARTTSAMPLVQFALSQLWEARDTTRRVLTSSAFAAMGGVAGALAQHGETTLGGTERSLHGGVEAVRRVLLLLTTPQGTRTTRERTEIQRLAGPAAGAVLDAFEAARLVVRLPTGYTLAHEALLSEWQRLHAWVAAARGARLLVEEFEEDAARFAKDREGVRVWRKRRLVSIMETIEREELELREAGQVFLQASLRAERMRVVTVASILGALALLVAVGAGLYLRAVRAEQARTEAALRREQAARLVAETRTREVQKAQQRIDELLQNVASSPAKTEVLTLRDQILGTPPRIEPKPPSSPAMSRPPLASSSAAPAPIAPGRPSMRVLSDWR